MPPSDIESRYRAGLALRFGAQAEDAAPGLDELVRRAEEVLATASTRARATVEGAERAAREMVAEARRESARILAEAGSKASALRQAALRSLPAVEARAEEAARTRGRAAGRHQAEVERSRERRELARLLSDLQSESGRAAAAASELAVDLAIDLAAGALDLCRDEHAGLLAAACRSAARRLGEGIGLRLLAAPGVAGRLRQLAASEGLGELAIEEDSSLTGTSVRLVSSRQVLVLDPGARLGGAGKP